MLTSEQLQSIMPRVSATRNSELLPFLTSAMAEFAIEAPARAAAFLAQLAHESGQFRFMEEIWGPTDAQSRYEPVTRLSQDLGNTEVGDGKRFKGRGPIQLTGRANYKRFGDLLDLDLVADPPRAAKPDVAFRVAGLYWSKNGLNELADVATAGAFKEITRRINGGTNGLAERQAFYAVARRVLGVTNAPLSRGGTRSGPSMPIDESTFQRGSEAIRAHEREPRRRTARPRRSGRKRPAKRAARSARTKAATRTRTRRPSRSSTSRSSKTRLKKKR
jgi:putative chitinase